VVKIIIIILSIRARWDGFEVAIAKPQDMEEVFRLRYKVYCEEKGYVPVNEKEMFHDKYDNFSDIIVIKHKNTIISTLRITYNNFYGFTTENYFNVNLNSYSKANICCVGRWSTLKDYRKKGANYRNIIDGILFYYISYILIKNNIKFVLFDSSEALVKSLEKRLKINFDKLETLADEIYHRQNREKDIGGYFSKYSSDPVILNFENISILKKISTCITIILT